MLDHFTIFTRNGLVLWSKTLAPSLSSSTNNPVDSLIRSSFIEERAAEAKFDQDGYTLRWTFANEVELVFVVVYQRILQLSYIPELLDNVKSLFVSQFGPFARALSASTRGASGSSASPSLTDFSSKLGEWDATFTATLRRLEKTASARKRIVSTSASGSQPTTPLDERAPPNLESSAPGTPSKDAASTDVARNVEALKARLKAEGGGSPVGRRGGGAKNRKSKVAGAGKGSETPGTSGTDTPTGKKKATKEMRKWDANGNAIDVRAMDQLDFSGAKAGATSGDDEEEGDLSGWVDERSLGKKNAEGMYEIADVRDESEDDDDDEEEEQGESSGRGGFLSRFGGLTSSSTPSLLSRITGSQPLTRADLAPALSAMQAHLQSKNVAADVASRLCDSVAQGLVGKQLGSFGSVKKEVRRALEEAITRILTPKSSTDILLEIATKRQRAAGAGATKEPYSIAFVGVNGVGKSTNLSKVCFWLLQNKLRVLIAACDTFRSGAVEQLRVHVRNLSKLEVDGETVGDAASSEAKIELYERGYGKDAAGIAKEALTYAKKSGFDVVLIDTAGRMQDNEPLMRALAKLVAVNSPDKIIFVGEALVGNEAVDQLTKFDRSLKDFSGVSRPRGLDGMLLTKFDTIDDKVGTSLTATSVTGLPIYFVGVGQTYTDLKQLRVKHIVAALMRD